MNQQKRKRMACQNFKKSTLPDQKIKDAVRMLFADGMKVQDVAAAMGVHRCTIWRWSHTKAFKKEWDRLARERIRVWRREMGIGQRRAAHRAKLKRLEKKMNEEAAKVKTQPTKAFNRAWKDYVDCLFEGENRPFRWG